MNKNLIYAYSCDFSLSRGEGILANNFIQALSRALKKKVVLINLNKKKNFDKKINHNFLSKYLSPLKGIFLIWLYHLRGLQTCYVNYLPLWNVLLFIFLPRKTILGPITGGTYHGNKFYLKSKIRKKIIKILYSLSIYFIVKKKTKFIFSTNLLNTILPKIISKDSLFNFQLYNHKFYKIKKKNIDIIFYNREHVTKNNIKLISILRKLNKNFKILIVGHYIKDFKNLGILNRKKLLNYLKKTRFIFSSPENLISFFSLDAISCGAKVITTKSFKKKKLSNYFIKTNKLCYKNIHNILSKKNFVIQKNSYLLQKKFDKKIELFIKKIYEN